jgi:SAM-dependent methyltransferase
MFCTLCSTQLDSTHIIKDKYFYCPTCMGVVKDVSTYLSPEAEKARYLLHNNDIIHEGYQNFTAPVSDYILRHFLPVHKGLDYGCGKGPVISHKLKINHYLVNCYDPYFFPDEAVLQESYDYIICSEVAEHFYHPAAEFDRLNQMLNPNGRLILMTLLYDDHIDFNTWHYRSDPTHVFFYSEHTIEFICRKFNFKKLLIEGRLIVLKK